MLPRVRVDLAASPSDCLVSYPRHSLQRCSQRILQPQPSGFKTKKTIFEFWKKLHPICKYCIKYLYSVKMNLNTQILSSAHEKEPPLTKKNCSWLDTKLYLEGLHSTLRILKRERPSGYRIYWLHLCRRVRAPTNECPFYDAILHLIGRVQCWSFRECGVPFHCHYS